VVECLGCTHQYCSPLPQQFGEDYRNVIDQVYLTQQDARLATYRKILPIIQSRCGGGRLLDIGCATGDFLHCANEHNFNSQGLEPSTWSSSIAESRGLIVHRIFAERLADINQRFDVATLWGVLEHFKEPYVVLKNVYNSLSERGIVALWTGDVASITSKILGRRWWYWQGQHIQYFTRKSLETLARKIGFLRVEFVTFPITITPAMLRNSLKRYRIYPILSAISSLLFLGRGSIQLKIPGEIMAFFYKQKI